MTNDKIGWKGVALPIIAVVMIFGVGYIIGQYQKGNALPQGIGTGDDDFWTIATTHPSWAADAVRTAPVLIFTHSTNCDPCIEQADICDSVNERYSTQISYFDFVSGIDPEAPACFDAYDPDDGTHYIPLTVVLTMGPDGAILWHSWEGVVEESTLSGWVEQAIEYNEQYGSGTYAR